MQAPTPQAEHHWLQKMVGEWTYDNECSMGPDQPPMKHSGTETVRSLGGLWTVGEGTNEHGTSFLTIGYDPKLKRFVGTFIATMMTNLWVYDGELDAEGKVLTLAAEGPTFTGDGSKALYQDIFEYQGDDRRTLTSRVQQPDGTWRHFMTAVYTRKQ